MLWVIFLDRRGSAAISFNQIYWLGRLLYLIMVVVAIAALVNFYVKVNFDTYVAETELFSQRLLYSPGGLSFHDPYTNRVRPGFLDLSRFDASFLNDSINYGDDDVFAAELQVFDLDEEGPLPFVSVTFNPERFEDWAKLSQLPGRGGYYRLHKRLLAFVNVHQRLAFEKEKQIRDRLETNPGFAGSPEFLSLRSEADVLLDRARVNPYQVEEVLLVFYIITPKS